MGTWRVPTAFVLLAQLMTLSNGNIDGTDEFEKILSKNVSIILIENKASETSNETLENVTSLTPEYNNFSLAPDTTTTTTTTMRASTMSLKTEEIIEAELKEALANAGSTSQVILISTSQAENENSTAQLLGPLIVIESDPTRSPSSIDNDKNITNTSNFDQEIAQSQILTRSNLRDYAYDDDIENLQDLLAIAEYEPQRIDAKRIEKSSTQPSRDQTTHQVQTTIRPLPEETHYDVPKRENAARNLQRISEYPRSALKTNLDESSANLPFSATSSSSRQSKPEITVSSLHSPENNHKTERKKFSLPLSFDHKKLTNNQAELSREPRHLEKFVPLTKKSAITGVSSLSREIQDNWKNNNNHENISESLRKNHRSSPMRNSWISLPFRSSGQNETYHKMEKTFQPIFTSSVIPRAANRRADDYSSPGYVNSMNHEINPLASDQRLGFLTRYNLPSLVTARITKPRSYQPVTLPYVGQTGSGEKAQENEKNEDSSKELNRRNTGTNLPVEYSDEEPEEKSERGEKNFEKNSYVDHSRKMADGAVEDAPIYDSYENEDESRAAKFYRDGEIAPLASTTPVYEYYDVYEKPESLGSNLHRENSNLRVQQRQNVVIEPYAHSPTKIIYHPYGYSGRQLSPITPINNLPNGESLYSTISSNNVYNSYINYPTTRPTTISRGTKKTRDSYETYEDSAESRPVRNENIRNSNWVDERYENFKKLQKIPHILSSNVNSNYDDREKNKNDHSTVTIKNVSSLPLTRVAFSNNPQRTSNPIVGLSSPAVYAKSSDYDSNEHDEKIHSPTSARRLVEKLPRYEEQNNRAIDSAIEAPVYDSNEDNNQDYILSASGAISSERKTNNYGNRIEPSIVNKNLISHSHARVSPVRLKNLPIHRKDNRRISPSGHDHESVESAKRADLEDSAAYDDEEPASSGHQENRETHAQSRKDDGGGDVKSEKGGGEQHEEAHHGSHGEKGEKGYKKWDEYDKMKKGHHDKENLEKEYDEKKGEKKEHEDVSGYHKEEHQGEKGEKESEFEEKGNYEKGQNTKGHHVVIKKDEYEKKTEFYDESHEEDGDEKEGAFHYEHENKKGGHEKIGHHKSAVAEDEYGEKGEHEKGQHYDETKGHEDKNGRDQDHHHEAKYGKKGAHEEGKKWSHKKGDNRKR